MKQFKNKILIGGGIQLQLYLCRMKTDVSASNARLDKYFIFYFVAVDFSQQ